MSYLRKYWIFLLSAVALLHLTLVSFSAAQRGPTAGHLVGRALSYYGELSGATSGYGFFAPGVGGNLRVQFEAVSPDGSVRKQDLLARESHESFLRIGNLFDWFWKDTDEKEKRSFAASWAAKVFSQYPSSVSVTVRIESYSLPTMKDFAKGEQPSWVPYYEAKFRRNAAKS